MTSPFVAGTPVRIPGARAGPLAGLTFAAKDRFDVAGHPTGGGNPDWARQHPVPTRHAWSVQRLLDAGATLIGKTVTDEVSLGILGENPFDGTPLNPAAPDRVPGGSSSGSAFPVAPGLRDTAPGTAPAGARACRSDEGRSRRSARAARSHGVGAGPAHLAAVGGVANLQGVA